jgi:cytoplasmic iron level regulating protein YaaA (DUF328/UPF0246 family)
MSISEKLAKLNQARFQSFSVPFNLNNAKQALLAFKGDVYSGLDAGTFSAQDFQFAQRNLRILSGLYGVLKPLDLIQPYRLEMGTRLHTSQGKNLYKFWADKIAKTLNKDTAKTLINLASNEYFKGIDTQALNANIIHIVFKERKNNTHKVIGIHAKRARGLMVRFVIKNQLTQPEKLKKFTEAGYCFNTEMSNKEQWVFTRN